MQQTVIQFQKTTYTYLLSLYLLPRRLPWRLLHHPLLGRPARSRSAKQRECGMRFIERLIGQEMGLSMIFLHSSHL